MDYTKFHSHLHPQLHTPHHNSSSLLAHIWLPHLKNIFLLLVYHNIVNALQVIISFGTDLVFQIDLLYSNLLLLAYSLMRSSDVL